MRHIRGTSRSDKLKGTADDDLIFGFGGQDLLFGRGGDDKIHGDGDDDHLFGNAGNDRLDGGAGDDTIRGGSGKDDVRGDTGNDKIYGGAHRDDLDGGRGDDKVHGGSAKDTILGGTGDDHLFGNAGNDILSGDSGNDIIKGGGGFDTALFKGSILDYDITIGARTTVEDLAPGRNGNDGTDVLKNVEKLSFNDYDLFLDGRNNDPIAQDDHVAADEDTPLLITDTSLLANDLEFDMDALSIVSIDTSDTVGDVTQNLDGSFTYDGSVAFAGLAAGEKASDSFKYMVDDGHGGTSMATVDVTITGTDNQAPVASLDTARGEPLGFTNYETVFDASGSFDPDGTIAEYHFNWGDGNTQTSNNPTVSHTYTAGGDFTATLTVIDNDGAASSQFDFDITVRDPAPLVADFITNPDPPTGVAPFTVNATNTSTSADTSITNVVWLPGDGGAPVFGDTFNYAYSSPGNYTLFMQVTDDLGRTASAFDDVTVALF